jgi:hypothetical protein
MALSDFRNTTAWQKAIELGSHIVQLADELPAGEQMGLAMILRRETVHLPAVMAADAEYGHQRAPRVLPALQLMAALDIIDKVYPALDTAQARTRLDEIIKHLDGAKTGEAHDGGEGSVMPKTSPAESAEPQAAPTAPANVPVIADAATTAEFKPSTPVQDEANPALKVPVAADTAEDQENHVHPDRVQ